MYCLKNLSSSVTTQDVSGDSPLLKEKAPFVAGAGTQQKRRRSNHGRAEAAGTRRDAVSHTSTTSGVPAGHLQGGGGAGPGDQPRVCSPSDWPSV